jgi:hypothetical protein
MAADAVFKKNDTNPTLDATLTNADGTTANLSGGTVEFHMRAPGASTLKVNQSSTGSLLSITDSTGGEVSYAWSTGDLDTTGRFYGEFEATLATGKVVTYPNDGHITIDVLDDLD